MTEYRPTDDTRENISITIDESYRRNDIGFSSLGVESKYYKDGYWYKQDISGYEGLAEEQCSMLLRYSNLKNYVEYEACTINGKSGCRNKNFLKEGETVITFKRLYEIACGGDLMNQVYTFQDVEERIRSVLEYQLDRYKNFFYERIRPTHSYYL